MFIKEEDDDVNPITEAELYMHVGEPDKAVEILTNAHNHNPRKNEITIALIKVYIQTKQKKPALRLYEKLQADVTVSPALLGELATNINSIQMELQPEYTLRKAENKSYYVSFMVKEGKHDPFPISYRIDMRSIDTLYGIEDLEHFMKEKEHNTWAITSYIEYKLQ